MEKGTKTTDRKLMTQQTRTAGVRRPETPPMGVAKVTRLPAAIQPMMTVAGVATLPKVDTPRRLELAR